MWENDVRPYLVQARAQLQAAVDSINVALPAFEDPEVIEKWTLLRDNLLWMIGGIDQQIAYGDLIIGVIEGE